MTIYRLRQWGALALQYAVEHGGGVAASVRMARCLGGYGVVLDIVCRVLNAIFVHSDLVARDFCLAACAYMYPCLGWYSENAAMCFLNGGDSFDMKIRESVYRAVVLLLFSGVCAVRAGDQPLINVNFNSWVPAHNPGPGIEDASALVGPAGGLGTFWNQFASHSSTNTIFDSAGEATTVTVSTDFTEGRYDGTGPSLRMLRSTLVDHGRGQDRMLTILGLEPGGSYHIWIVSHRHQSPTRERQKGTWTALNSTISATTQEVDGTDGALNGSSFVAGVNYVWFENVVADAEGQIRFRGKGADIAGGADDDYRNHLSGLQIQVAEPVELGPVDALASSVVAAQAEVEAGGIASTTVTVSLRDAQGFRIPGEEVQLSDASGVAQIDSPSVMMTDGLGEAVFTVRSEEPGTATFTATVLSANDLVLSQVAPIVFVESLLSDIFSVNLYAFGRQHAGDTWTQPAIRETVQLNSGEVAGAGAFATAGWQNILARVGETSISSRLGQSATFDLIRQRNAGPHYWTSTRNAATFEIPDAKMLDAKSNGTFDPGDGSLHSVFAVRDIPFAAYDFVIYFGISQAQSGNGRGTIRINGGAARRFTLLTTEPDGTLVEITDETTPGNYLVYRGYADSTLHIEIRGDGSNHLGPAGIQIAEADRARPPLEITGLTFDPALQQATLTWRSFPGDVYGVYWSDDLGEFAPFINPVVNAHPEEAVTTYGPFAVPVRNPERGMFRIGPADSDPPRLERVRGHDRTIHLTFSEPMMRDTAKDPSNYLIESEGGASVAISSIQFYPSRETVMLTTSEPLALDTVYTVTLHHLTDLAGYALEGDSVAMFRTWDDNPDGVRVFILSGQSNMVGRGSRENGHGGVAGAIGSLRYLAIHDTANYGHLLLDPEESATSAWRDRSDVQLWWNRAASGGAPNITQGDLGPATAPTTFGPEYGFGWVVGDHFDQPVLLIKSCWGGRSLFVDFRSPRAVVARGGDVGPYYYELLAHVRQALDDLDSAFPAFAGMGYQIAGFGWHQGWNDSLHTSPAAEYEANMADFIRDLRDELGQPDLPVVIGATGHGGFNQPEARATVLEGQLAVADPAIYPEFAGTIHTVDTRPFYRDGSVSPVNDGSHWNNNGETFFLIGDAMGREMLTLLLSE